MSKVTEMPPHGNTKYPWELWENGQPHRVRHGKHFTITAESFRKSLQKRAHARGLKVTTRVSGDTVTFQFSTRQ